MPTIYKDGYEYGAGGGAADLTKVNEAIETIYNLLTDSESGTAALKVLIDSTLQNETAIKNIVNSTDYGNAKIKSVIDTINTNTAASKAAITNTTYGLNALQALLTNGTYGLNALKMLLDTVNSNASNANTNAKSANTLLKNTTYGLSALNTDLDNIISSLGNSTYGLSALKTAISASSSGGDGAVKSVQRGLITTEKSSSVLTKTVTISSVNPNKCFVILNDCANNGNSSTSAGTVVSSLTSTELKIWFAPSHSTQTHTISWQVVEFY